MADGDACPPVAGDDDDAGRVGVGPDDVHVDIAIVGDGLVGRPLALALAGRGWRVALIDRQVRDPARVASRDPTLSIDPLEERCTALSIAARDWLQAEGLWDETAARAESIRRVRVSHRGHFGATRLQADELGEQALGATIENRCLIDSWAASLRTRIESGRIRHVRGAMPRAVSLSGDTRCIDLQDEAGQALARVRAGLLIAADGAGSRTGELLGIQTTRHDYRQTALLCTVRLDRDHDGLAIERFTAEGPLALLPRPDRHLNVVACLSPERAIALQGLSAAGWLAELNRLAPVRLGRMIAAGPRLAVPLQRIEAQRTQAARALLLGNAARLLHPVAGQGYNLALRDVAALVRLIGPGGPGGTEGGGPFVTVDPGAPALIDAFIAARRPDRRRTVRLTDALARTFRGRFAPLGHARAAGLVALDAIGPARRAFARVAMGRQIDGAGGSTPPATRRRS